METYPPVVRNIISEENPQNQVRCLFYKHHSLWERNIGAVLLHSSDCLNMSGGVNRLKSYFKPRLNKRLHTLLYGTLCSLWYYF